MSAIKYVSADANRGIATDRPNGILESSIYMEVDFGKLCATTDSLFIGRFRQIAIETWSDSEGRPGGKQEYHD
jgi:hypothetical protein